SDHYVLVDVISAKDKRRAAAEKAQEIINYIEQNDITDECLGLIQNLGNMPAPILTEEGRLVFRLQFMCVYGE
ncbi:phage tail termination protein, partial [Escherichia coli]|uniref:phage tail termination protein n=1 Tax=Escherichia coli TaxID=562 RepID=UPI003EC05033